MNTLPARARRRAPRWSKLLVVALVGAFASSGCVTVKFRIPLADSSLGGTAPLEVEVKDTDRDAGNVPPGEAQFSLDGVPIGAAPCSGQSCRLQWDTTSASQGWHTVRAEATNARGAKGSSQMRVRIPSACFSGPPSGPGDYQRAFDSRRGGWAAADGAIPVPLPDGRVLWLFGDTYAGDVDEQNALVAGYRLVTGNSYQVQSGNCFTPVLGGTPSAPTANLRPDEAGAWYWPSGGWVDDSVDPPVLRIAAALGRHDSDCGWGWRVASTEIVTLTLPGLELISREAAPVDRNAENMIALNQFALDGDDVYFYGSAGGYQCEGFRPGGPFAPGRYVARATTAAPTDWEFWTGSGWDADVEQAAPMHAADGSDLPSLNVTKYGSGFLGTGRLGLVGFLTPQVLAYYAPTPHGPWHPLGEIVPAEPTLPGARIYYSGQVRMNIPGTSQDEPMIVYSTNGAGGPDGQTKNNVLIYGPHFVRPTGLASAADLAAQYPEEPEEPPTTTTTEPPTTTTTEPEPTTTTTEPEPTTTTTEPEPTTTTTEPEPTTTTTEPEPTTTTTEPEPTTTTTEPEDPEDPGDPGESGGPGDVVTDAAAIVLSMF